MVAKKFYCHKCGERLIKNPHTRMVKRGDPDYKKYSAVGRMHLIGDITVTEYDFKCPACNEAIGYDEQYVIEKIQKKLNNYIIYEAEIQEHKQEALLKLLKKRKIIDITVKIISAMLLILVLYLTIKKL